MKRKWIALVLSVSVLAGTEAVPAFASEMQQEISEMSAVETLQDHTLAETDSVEENCVLVGLKGSYLASADAALKRINEIRKEACKQGVQDPRDPNRIYRKSPGSRSICVYGSSKTKWNDVFFTGITKWSGELGRSSGME